MGGENKGNSTAAAVAIGGELQDAGGETVEESEANLDYVPQRSERRAGLIFSRNPADYALVLRVKGYAEP